MNSPNVYQKVEVLETGTPDPKKITKVEVAVIEDLGTSKARKKNWIMQNKQKLPNPSPMMSTVAEKFCNIPSKMLFFFVLKIENLHEVISFN